MTRKRRTVRAICVLSGSVVLILLISFVLGMWGSFNRRERAFDSQAWKSSNCRDRGRMVRDLVARDLLHGSTPDEVRELLGPPDDKLENEWDYSVDLGERFMFAKWGYHLIVNFDNDTQKVDSVMVLD